MANLDFIAPTGKYEEWNVYKLSLVIVDITDLFVKTYLDKYHVRTVDQMVQAARSCKQNIVEGSMAAATSRETEIKLTNVAKASLGELREDYRDYLRHNDLPIWPKYDPRVNQIRDFSRTHQEPGDFLIRLRQRSPEAFCNIALTLCHQLDYMLYCVIERAKAIFLKKGGIKEEMYRARKKILEEQRRFYHSNQSYQSNPPTRPPKPETDDADDTDDSEKSGKL